MTANTPPEAVRRMALSGSKTHWRAGETAEKLIARDFVGKAVLTVAA